MSLAIEIRYNASTGAVFLRSFYAQRCPLTDGTQGSYAAETICPSINYPARNRRRRDACLLYESPIQSRGHSRVFVAQPTAARSIRAGCFRWITVHERSIDRSMDAGFFRLH